jgi:hypothetical protein
VDGILSKRKTTNQIPDDWFGFHCDLENHSMTTEDSLLLLRLSFSLKTLAADPAEQIAYLSSFGSGGSADELALEFDDIYRALQPRWGALGVSKSMAINLKALDDALQKMSGVVLSLLWTFKALSDSAEWVAVRNIAQDAANELDLRGRTSDL